MHSIMTLDHLVVVYLQSGRAAAGADAAITLEDRNRFIMLTGAGIRARLQNLHPSSTLVIIQRITPDGLVEAVLDNAIVQYPLTGLGYTLDDKGRYVP